MLTVFDVSRLLAVPTYLIGTTMAASPLRYSLIVYLSFPLLLGTLPADWGQSIISQASNASTATAPAQVSLDQVPSGATRPYHVGIQSGHYQESQLPVDLARLADDTGTAGGGRKEVDLNWDVSNRVAKLLQDQGVVVDVLPATVPSGYTADAFVAIHADGNASPNPRGFKISTRWSSTVAVQDVKLVETLTGVYGAATGLPQDDAVTRNMRGYYAYTSRRANYRISALTPAAIVEMGYMTNAADRAVLFYDTDTVARGIANGIMAYLKSSYGSPATGADYGYGYGLVDKNVNPLATPMPTPARGSPFLNPNPTPDPRPVKGDWQVVLMGNPTVNVYSGPGGQGPIVAKLPWGQVLHSTLRRSDYYQVDLPDGSQGWVSRMSLVVQQ
jgi:N-acetylmuramoyl-L-alanine amidase